jgi:PmbA protein
MSANKTRPGNGDKTAAMIDIARRAVATAKKSGAQQAAANGYRGRDVQLNWRDGKLEKVSEAVSRSLEMQLYVDGRYAALSTSDLRPDAVDKFIAEAVALTRTLAADVHRGLPEPDLYAGQSTADLEIDDARHGVLTPDERLKVCKAVEAAARSVDGNERILSVDARWNDTALDLVRVASNGFEGTRRATYFESSADVAVQDPDGRRPDYGVWTAARHLDAIQAAEEVGRRGAVGALARVGAKKGKSAVVPVVVDNRVAGRLVNYLLAATSGRAVQQKQSFLDGKLNQVVASPRLSLVDDPLLKRGLASQRFDGEGMAARTRTLFEDGTLRSYFIDCYYGRKLKMAPTTARWSNLVWRLGERDQAALVGDVKDGIFISSFIGGNSNTTTGDFSLGFQGYAIRGGKMAEPLAEMNLSGNHLELWKHLAAVGNDPFIASSMRTPTLDGVQVAGT